MLSDWFSAALQTNRKCGRKEYMSMEIDKWAERIYLEEDFGKNIATTISGLIGLSIYLFKADFALAAFVAIILFPLFKILANSARAKQLKNREEKGELETQKENVLFVKNLTDQERRVIHEFVQYNASVLPSKYVELNNIHLPDGAVKSLIQRDILKEKGYGLSNQYDLVLKIEMFEAGRRYFEK